ncbi:hypothetical protein A3A76_03495 [Candidatus Woesebacteria bacterium RIFCSPLOWO2_01_FULL_39_23]|uniref:Penicillin-binding protein transpeptidase domain-containing protein n=1 Tax=Candidatus Woesebacteria bacterium RIFCSPHIGHO2_01_FULL_40_22 TaxID=1802499 RepID=A0A1F7YJZ8_9BACT|nr:MAG: hypothetical protein A2141_00530 [Candidatus Woesebacteria bacterium RBG_16_40_11]OGM27520.1 MAG: hypothetical protein A2628_01895 [Candidatus Woesebacteria bacterium RIFCSPHIGHO2_01_FULL_40_22]OGM36112.1 MAG: hypothetical protein A3E41_02135 [Candidatus Woesebacteria bacterium RIFCSPHIGHO2_12_FULL_38_9]OGM62694.1 MAG: hypothetical protein A3A76_03495 [Candidatus Woesebacteria bacterium RIFCSPLOWO2_01_FULL_39_23]
MPRLKVFTILIYLAFALVIGRLFYWQIIKGDALSASVRFQHEAGYVISAPRGNIKAHDKSFLVASQDNYLLFASLNELSLSPTELSNELAPFLAEDQSVVGIKNEEMQIKEALSRTGVVWVPIKHQITSTVKKNIEALKIRGIGFDPEEGRFYPEASSAAQLLGFVGKNSQGEDKGYFGLEGYYDLVLSGKPGFMEREEDVFGDPILIGKVKEIGAIEGVDLVTYIDKTVQLALDVELKKGVEKYGAKSGSVIVMDPMTGGVLGMSSYPNYDPSKYWEYGNEFFLNPAISSSFEPGSVFKVIVMASALDAHIVNPDTKCETCYGPLKVDKYSIETWNNVYHPNSSMTEVIVNSDNVGMAFTARKLGEERMLDYLKKFGIGSRTEIDLQGESSPALRSDKDWSEVDLVTAGFGQGIAVTPIQLIRAVGAIANRGILMKPKVVSELTAGDREFAVDKNEGVRVISQETSSLITAMMVEAAKHGESKWTYQKGFKVAGKTGTAQIPIAGHYDADKTNASFIGFAPYDKPKFIMFVTLQEPASSPWASETAAPLWYTIARKLFLYFDMQPEGE